MAGTRGCAPGRRERRKLKPGIRWVTCVRLADGASWLVRLRLRARSITSPRVSPTLAPFGWRLSLSNLMTIVLFQVGEAVTANPRVSPGVVCENHTSRRKPKPLAFNLP